MKTRSQPLPDTPVELVQHLQVQKQSDPVFQHRDNGLDDAGRLLELSYDAIFVRDANNRISFWNRGAQELYGWGPEEALGRNPHELLKTVFPEPLETINRKLAEAGRWEGELLHSRNDNSQVVVTSRWVLDAESRQHGPRVLEINRDITERKQAVEALMRVKQQLEAQVRERTATLRDTVSELEHFSYTLSHDMRAPLRAMHAFTGILLDEAQAQLAPEHQDYLQRIAAAAHRMDNLITDALQYSLVLRGKYELEPVDVSSLLREMLDSYPQFQRPAALIELVDPIPPVLASRAGLTQCFSNLLANAVKFVAPGVVPQVRIWAEEIPNRQILPLTPHASHAADRWVRIWMQDNGIGIPGEYQEKIWEMFQRLHREYEGTGIGLPLVRKAAQRMGGSAGVESEPGQGSRFWLELRKAETMPHPKPS